MRRHIDVDFIEFVGKSQPQRSLKFRKLNHVLWQNENERKQKYNSFCLPHEDFLVECVQYSGVPAQDAS